MGQAEDAWQAGKRARLEGRPVTDNPHKHSLGKAWRNGWQQAVEPVMAVRGRSVMVGNVKVTDISDEDDDEPLVQKGTL